MAASLRTGDKIPDFTLQNQDGQTVRRDDLLGKGPFVVYFYPRNETPVCTAEACSFRDQFAVFSDLGAAVYGVSDDTVESHRAFATHHRLPFTLLSDRTKSLRDAFGVPRTLGFIEGRVTYVFDAQGVLHHQFSSAFRASKHVDEALEVVRRLGGVKKA